MRLQIGVFAAVLLASVSNAWAANITYNIIDYPANQTDVIVGGTDMVSGTIITDGTLGDWGGVDHVVGGTLTFVYSGGSFTGPLRFSFGSCVATSTQLLEPAGERFDVETNAANQPWPAPLYFELTWWRTDEFNPAGRYCSQLVEDLPYRVYASFDTIDPPDTPGSVAANDPWIIAEVPEPGTLTLLGIGAVSLLAYGWRKRK